MFLVNPVQEQKKDLHNQAKEINFYFDPHFITHPKQRYSYLYLFKIKSNNNATFQKIRFLDTKINKSD
jgi:hypothetical protein